jgi:RNA polymerase sigma-70 factor (ECF subfamily)
MTMEMGMLEGLHRPTAEADADRLAVVDLQARRGPELYGFARRLGLGAEAAEDAVQETLLRAWTALAARTPVRDLDAWSFTTLYRVCMDQHRWRRRVQRLAERLRPTPQRSEAASVADRLTLWGAVDRLPERQRAVVHLRYRADLTFEQIGEILHIKPVSARSHASRALDALASLLAEEEFR